MTLRPAIYVILFLLFGSTAQFALAPMAATAQEVSPPESAPPAPTPAPAPTSAPAATPPPGPNLEPTPVAEQTPAPAESAQPPQATSAAPTTPAAPSASATPAPASRQKRAKRKVGPRAPSRRAARGEGLFQVPLRFDPSDNGLSVDNPQLKWVFRPEDDVLDFGDFPLIAADIRVSLDQIRRAQAPVKYDARKLEKWVTSLSFRWPENLTKTGEVSIETLEGEKLWHFRVGEAERKLWADEVSFATAIMKKNHKDNGWGRFDLVRSEFEFLYKGGIFRACLTNEETMAERLKMCTPPFKSRSKGDLVRFFPLKEKDNPPKPKPPGFYLADQKLKDTGILNFPLGKPLELKIYFKSGAYVEISSQPADPKLLDVVESSSGKELIMTGAGAMPIGKKVRIIKKPIIHFWAPTGIPQERIWQAAFPIDSPTLAVRGAFNIPFTLLFTYDQLPREEDRIFIESTRSSGTFGAETYINGYIPSAGDISSKESAASKTDPYHFTWKFASPKSGEENRSRISIDHKDGNRPWVAHHRLFRSHPSEVSGRMTGILEADYTILILGEVSAAHYFETIANSPNPTFSKQRWGLAGRYFQTLSTLQTTKGSSVTDFSVLNIDLKYHLLPGVWHRDELVGLMLSMERITIAGSTVTLMGTGAYWARTMPKVFDDLFNLLPFMEYPKYVDMEFIYYPFSMSSGATGGLTFNLNFHGRVFWFDRFYGELGFGLRNYNFAIPSQSRPGQMANISLLTSYGTAGLGFIF